MLTECSFLQFQGVLPPTQKKFLFKICLHADKFLWNEYLTPHSRVLLEKLTVAQLVKKFLAFYGTQKFITAITAAH
jgi:hypothetical protein